MSTPKMVAVPILLSHESQRGSTGMIKEEKTFFKFTEINLVTDDAKIWVFE